MSESNAVVVSSATRTVDADNPWPGPEAFREVDEPFFFGRDNAIEEVSRLIALNRLVILYGRSGLGKTSLLRAGIFPKIRSVAGLPIYLRLDFASSVAPRLQVKEAIESMLARDHIDAPEVDPQSTLWEWFYRADMQFFNERSRRVRPVLVFDQFEEAFTHGGATTGRAAATQQFLDELIDLVRGNVPASVASRLEERPEGTLAFSAGRDPCGVLLALRQEFIPELLRLRPRLPTLLDRRFELTSMTTGDAEMVVTKAGGHLVEPGVATSIVSFVAGARRTAEDQGADDATVDPAILSIFCRELNAKRRADRMPRITKDLVAGSQIEIIADFYRGAVHDLSDDVREFIEERLVTEPGYRDSVAMDDGLAASGLTKDVIDTLIDRRIVRINGTGSRARLELTHDVLTDPIVQIRKIRRVEKREQEERQAALKAQRDEFEAADRDRKERERQRELETTRALLEMEKQRATLAQEKIVGLKRQWTLAIAAVAFLSLAGWGFYRARSETRSAEAVRRASEAGRLASVLLSQSQALRNSATSPLELSLLLGLESLKTLPTPEAILQISETARLLPFPRARLEHSGTIRSIVISPDERLVATVGGDNTVSLWDALSWRRIGQLQHDREVGTVVFSPDSKKVATLTLDGQAALWESAGTRLATLPLRPPVNGLAFRNARTFATADEDGAVVLWDATDPLSPREIARARHAAAVQELAFDPAGELLASSGNDVLKVWSVLPDSSLRELHALGRGQSAKSLVFVDRPDALAARLGWGSEFRAVLACLDIRSVLRIWSVPVKPTGAPWTEYFVKVPAGTELASNGSAIARALSGTSTQPAPALERISRRANGEGNPLIMSGPGFLSLGERESVLWSVSEGTGSAGAGANLSASSETRDLAMLAGGEAVSGAVADNLGYVVTGYRDGIALVWPMRGAAQFSTLSENGKRAALRHELSWSEEPFQPPYVKLRWPSHSDTDRVSVALNADGTLLAAGDSQRVAIWKLEARTYGQLPSMESVSKGNEGVPFAMTLGASSLLVPRVRAVELYANQNGEKIWEQPVSGLAGAALAPGGSRVATWTTSGVLNLWNVSQQSKTDRSARDSKGIQLNRPLSRVMFDPTGTVVAVCSGAPELTLFDAATGERREPIRLGDACRSFAFDAAGTTLAVGTEAGAISIINYATRNVQRQIRLDRPVVSLAFSPTASFVASKSADGIVQVWNTADDSEISRFTVPSRADNEDLLSFSNDERVILTNGSLSRWKLKDVMDDGCARVTRNLSDDERDRYRLPKAGDETCRISPAQAGRQREP